MMLPYAATIFLGAFLLFQVQPLMGKFVLPWFGGGPGVWTTCLMFFQVLLLGGYAYAHWITRHLKPKTQAWLHLALLVAAIASLPIVPGEHWKPRNAANPSLHIIALLAGCVGLPYFVLSSTGPLVQRWFHSRYPERSPYRLYALSNAGSLLALISFPFVFEPRFTRKAQAALWGGGLILYAIGCAFCALANSAQTSVVAAASGSREESSKPTPLQKALWVLLPATGSVLLLAITNKLCQDVTVVPFLWVLPLSLYLLSFVLCFDSERWYRRTPFTLALVAALAGLCWALFDGGTWPLWQQLGVYCSGLFICCTVCHGEVYRLRPRAEKLTGFYLGIAAGGALGGLFVALVAPRVFANYYELHWGMLACALLLVVICLTEGSRLLPTNSTECSWPWLACLLPLAAFGGLDWCIAHLGANNKLMPKPYLAVLRVSMWVFLLFMLLSWVLRQRKRRFIYWRALACVWLLLGLVVLCGALRTQARTANPDKILTARNFYGVLTLYDHRQDDPKSRHLLLQHGRITHGLQFVDPEQATWATTYYGAESGVGLALDSLPSGPRRIGLVGLGAGTLASYARPGDYLRIYEINPEVIRLATSRFSFLRGCGGKVEVIAGDARLSMERELPQRFDLLALDAFSSDAIPTHLLTREAFELYGRHLKTNGVIAVHISNHFLDLAPVVLNLARQFDYFSAVIDYDETPEEWWLYASTWVLLTRNSAFLETPEISAAAGPVNKEKKLPLWTDDFTSVFQILKQAH